MRHIIVLAVLLATTLASGPAEIVPVDRVEGRRTGKVNPRPEWVDRSGEPGPVWTALEGLTRAERANAVINFDLGHATPEAWSEAGAIEELWNSGDFEGAIERLRGISRFHNPCDIFVGMSWREPIPTLVGADWEDNIRIGNRDSVYEIELDRNRRTGNLFLVSLRDAGSSSYINVYMSTNAGMDWDETYNAATSMSYINAIGAICNGSDLYVGYTRNPHQTLGRVMRFAADSGNQVRFPNDSFYRTMFEAAANDSIQEVAMTGTDEQFPAVRMYAAGCTKGRKLEFGWCDSLAWNWHELPTNVTWCDGGLDLSYNPFYDTSRDRFVWASFIYERTDSLWNVGCWYYDTLPYGFYINPGFWETTTNTSIGAWGDSILLMYVRNTRVKRYVSSFYTRNGGLNWYYHHLPDTNTNREWVDVTGRWGAGYAVAARQYSPGGGRDLVYTYRDYLGGWESFEDISDYEPGLMPPRVVFIPRGRYGVAYCKWYQQPGGYYSIWFNRSDWTGVEDVTTLYPKFALSSVFAGDRAKVRFQNPRRGPVTLSVFDPAGRLVERVTRTLGPGNQELNVKARASGVHFAVIDIDGETETTRLTFAR